jgi:hypothetical protein
MKAGSTENSQQQDRLPEASGNAHLIPLCSFVDRPGKSGSTWNPAYRHFWIWIGHYVHIRGPTRGSHAIISSA